MSISAKLSRIFREQEAAEIRYLELIAELLEENAELKRELLIAQGKYYHDDTDFFVGTATDDGMITFTGDLTVGPLVDETDRIPTHDTTDSPNLSPRTYPFHFYHR